jgi:hypothetical protein
MSYTPIGEIARGFSSLLNPAARAIVVLRAYFDDSGTHTTSKAVVWAGFMATSDEWDQFEIDCAALLKKEKVACFHAVDLEHGSGEFADVHHWTQARRDLFRADFRRLISARNIIGIGAVVRTDGWNELSDPGLISRFINPIYLAFEHCMQQTLHWAERATEQQTGIIEKVSFFFDSRQGEAARCFDIAKNLELGWSRSAWFEGLSFAKMRNTLPLQAADALAYETYRLENDRIKSGKEPVLRENLKAMLEEIPIYGQYYDRQALDQLAAIVAKGSGDNLLFPQSGN